MNFKNKRNKYNARKTDVDGHTFDSKAEARRYEELKLLERAGEITGLELQPKFLLIPSYTNARGRKARAAHYIADFSYTDTDGKRIVEDVKGQPTELYRFKKKLTEFLYKEQGVTITEIRR